MKKYIQNTYDTLNYPLYSHYLKKNNVDKSKLLILGTIPRSGTHLMKFLFANYINLIKFGFESKAITPSEMNSFFPNNYQYSYINLKARPFGKVYVNNIEKPINLLKYIGLDDFTRSHAYFQRVYWKNSPVLHTYRNPLDYSVSMFNYMFKNRNSNLKINSPMEVFDQYSEYYISMYLSYFEASKKAKFKILRLSYEQLVKETEVSFSIILHWLGLEPNEIYISEASKRSSIKKVNTLEEITKSQINPAASLKKGSFISSGKTGQWKDYFSNSDIELVEMKLNKYAVSLDDFDID
jgi:hypothetical protein